MWYVTIGSRQVPLNITEKTAEAEAWEAFRKLLRETKEAPDGPPKTCTEMVSGYLLDVGKRVKAHTVKVYRWYLNQFVARFGRLEVKDVTAEAIEADSRRSTWSKTTRNNYLCTIETCLRWAGLKLRIRKPPKASAGAKSVIPEDVFRRMVMHCRGDWAAVINFLWHTGARPSEAARITAECVDWNAKVVRLAEHKTDAGGAVRVIYLNQQAAEILAWQRERHGTGLLFRSVSGGPLSTHAFVMKFSRLSRIVGRRVPAYGLRHSYATRALADGESDAVVAALLGHSNTGMIWKHYAHVSEMGRQLKDAADRIGKPGRESA
jgi:integrase